MEMAVIQLQRDMEECHAERDTQNGSWREARLRQYPSEFKGDRGTHRRRFRDTPGNQTGNSTERCSRPLCVRMAGTMSHGPTAAIPSGRGCTQRSFTGSGVSKGEARIFYKVAIRALQRPGVAEYKHQFQRAVRHPGADPSIFATELQTLARRAFMDIDLKIQSQMVRDRFIDGQAECALRRNLDSLGPNTPIPDIVDCCRIWERHCEVEIQRPVRVTGQVTETEPTPAMTPETETVVNIIEKLLPTPHCRHHRLCGRARYVRTGTSSSNN